MKATTYFFGQVFQGVVLRKNTLLKFEKRHVSADKYNLDSYRQYGVLLSAKENSVWLLTINGVKHFIPESTDQDSMYYLTLNTCIWQQAVKDLIKKQGEVNMREARRRTFNEWQKDAKDYSLRIINISYLSEDENKSLKRYRYIHAFNGLIYESDINSVCLN